MTTIRLLFSRACLSSIAVAGHGVLPQILIPVRLRAYAGKVQWAEGTHKRHVHTACTTGRQWSYEGSEGVAVHGVDATADRDLTRRGAKTIHMIAGRTRLIAQCGIRSTSMATARMNRVVVLRLGERYIAQHAREGRIDQWNMTDWTIETFSQGNRIDNEEVRRTSYCRRSFSSPVPPGGLG